MSVTDRGHLSIGEVLSLIQSEFPDVTISKIRFLESQGLIDPERTPSGYRKFYENDIDRLRWILVQQRDHFLPLKVIKDRIREAVALDLPLEAPAPRPQRLGATDHSGSAPDDLTYFALSDAAIAPGVAGSLQRASSEQDSAAEHVQVPNAEAGDIDASGAQGPVPTVSGLQEVAADMSGPVDPSDQPTQPPEPLSSEPAHAPSGTEGAHEPAIVDLRHGVGEAPQLAEPISSEAVQMTHAPSSPNPVEPTTSASASASASASVQALAPQPVAARVEPTGAVGPQPSGMASPGTAPVLTQPAHMQSAETRASGMPSSGTGPGVAGLQPAGAQSAGTDVTGTDVTGGQPAGTQSGGTQSSGTAPAGTAPRGTQAAGAPPTGTEPAGTEPELVEVGPVGSNPNDAGPDQPIVPEAGDAPGAAERTSAPAAGHDRLPGDVGHQLPARRLAASVDVSSVSFTLSELAAAVGTTPAAIEELERYGLIASRMLSHGRHYEDDSVIIARLAVRFAAFGIEARHLRMFRVAVDRELALYDQVVAPQARARGERGEPRETEMWAELDLLGAHLRDALFHRRDH